MKCKSCGANYKTRELKCPYCGKANALGRLWKIKRTEAEEEYERARKEAGRKISVYSVDRILSRCIVSVIGLFVLFLIGSFVFFFLQDKIIILRNNIKHDEIESTLREYYDNGDYFELDDYMDKMNLDRTEYYTYSQAVILYHSYEEYIRAKCIFSEMSPEEKAKDDYYIKTALNKSIDVYTVECGIYSEPASENMDLIESYRQEIMSFWIGSLELTEEEIEYISSEHRYLSQEEEESLTARIRDNGGRGK